MTPGPTRADTRAALVAALRGPDSTVRPPVGFVPTMGALHEGHASLMRRARAEVGPGGIVVVSVFVNPTQFAAGEDLARYPRTLPDDLLLCAAEGVDVVFTPSVEEVYPYGPFDPDAPAGVTVDPGPLGAVLEGRSRPTHFRGVLTVVAKLLGLVRPDVAVFGEKDYQQLVLIRQMAAELCLGVRIVGAETLREPDGLALSSRNRYLSAAERTHALTLSRALSRGRAAAPEGGAAVLAAAGSELARTPEVVVDYLELTDADLGPVPAAGTARLLLAARVGETRLIDNVAVELPEEL